jgi:heat shock protein HslJ
VVHRTLCAIGAVIVLAGCDEAPLAPSAISGETWRLVSLQEAGAAPIQVTDPTRYTIQFAEDSRLSVRSDCNSCGGPYALTGSSLKVGGLACTRVFCGDASLDARFTAALQQAQTASLDDELTIEGGGVRLRFRN